MILADKIIAERKKNGWSQEELAERIGVTRQAVSKWEGAQSTPDLQRVLEMSKVFGVSSDYLLKDEMEAPDYIPIAEAEDVTYRRISMEEASHFLQVKIETAPQIALATMLCIFSPICLLILGACAEQQLLPISEDTAGGIGMIIILIMVAIACAIFMACDSKTKVYDFLEKEPIDTEYGVSGMVKDKKRQYEATYTRYSILGTVLCILGAIPIFGCAIYDNDVFSAIMISTLLVLEGIGTRFFVIAGIRQASFDKLLQEGDYTLEEKSKHSMVSAVTTVYWLLVTAIFLLIGFLTDGWKYAGIVWPIAGVLYPAVLAIVKCFEKR